MGRMKHTVVPNRANAISVKDRYRNSGGRMKE